MPSHTPASALVKLYFALRGAPWNFTRWQEITNIHHGLNPEKDEHLPPRLTRDEITSILSYFDQYDTLGTEDAKIKFASNTKKKGKDPIPGRGFWTTWVNMHYSTEWKINSHIARIFSSIGIHPEQLMAATGESTPPSNASYLPLALEIIGRDIFGPEALDSRQMLLAQLRDPALILAQRAWFLETKSIGPRRIKVEKMKEKAETLLSELDKGNVTVRGINQAIRAVANYEKAIAALLTDDHAATLDAFKTLLERFIPDDSPKSKSGAKRVPKTSAKRKVTTEGLCQLATPGEVSQLLEMYDQFFGPESSSNEELDAEEHQFVSFGKPVDGADPGVEVEANMSASQLAANLGFKNGMPFLFNTKRLSSGGTAWSQEYEDACNSKPDDLEDFHLQWHQLAGVHAALRKVLSPTANPHHCTGILFADDVGLGKTIQASTIMASLTGFSVLKRRGLAPPPILRDYPFLKDSSTIPNLPHLVLVPGTLLRQWEHELQCFFRNKSVDILVYGTSLAEHEEFWKPGGIYYKSNQLASHRIILASQSSLQQDFSQLYTSQRGSRSLPWDHPQPRSDYETCLPNTLFAQKYLSVVFDEAQGVRNVGARHSSALRILEEASVRIVLTATPLQTSTKDISAMGRLTGIPHFFTYKAHREQISDNATLRRAKQERDADPSLTGEDDPMKIAQVEISKRLQNMFQNRVIRREAGSLDADGKELISLPPLKVIHCILHLTEREKEILEDITIRELGNASDVNSHSITSNTFYIEHRMGVTFAREDPTKPIPVFNSHDEWKEQLGTKIHNLVLVSLHYLKRDDMPTIRFVEGRIIYPPAPTTLIFTLEIKILVYQEFPSNTNLVRNIYQLHGVKTLAISGRDTYDQRAKTVRKFNEDPDFRVLILSKVGSIGLNLTRASIVIFLDQPWSAQDERQIIGRAWRQRQHRPVLAIHLLAAETADITLFSLAQGKKDMLDAFLTTDTSKALMQVMTGDVLPDEEDEDRPLLKVKRTRRKGESKKSKLVESEQTAALTEPDESKKSKKSKKSKQVESEKMAASTEPDESEKANSGKRSKETKGKGKGRVKSAPIVIDDQEEQSGPIEGSSRTAGSALFKPPAASGSDTDGRLDVDNDLTTDNDATTDDDRFNRSDVSMHESGSDMYETDFSIRPPSSHAYDSSFSSLVDYESSDDEMVGEPSIDPTVRHDLDPQAFFDADIEMVTDPPTEDPLQSNQETHETGLNQGSDMMAKKRARETSSPPAVGPKPTKHSQSGYRTSPGSRDESAIKRARLQKRIENPGMYAKTPDPMGDEEDATKSVLQPLSSLGVDDSPCPSLFLAPPSPSPLPGITARRGDFLTMKSPSFQFSQPDHTKEVKSRGLPDVFRRKPKKNQGDGEDLERQQDVSFSSIFNNPRGIGVKRDRTDVLRLTPKTNEEQDEDLERQQDAGSFSKFNKPRGGMGVNRDPTPFTLQTAQSSSSKLPPPTASSRPNPNAHKYSNSKRKPGPRP